ncbi:sulfatase-like hydrolase/transferase [Pedobacter sp. HMF7647]|uniref:Sulfatase-like hydrolase/transferase n=1 Tax=Hufsiella arboris TaxID=2695275 RepID=A0A7K1Y7L1_9SPHI|nr:sulfatase [Hufsiella arboris]MXV50562.1 sulfatase-like hydrolase/transferase [Hufsiella arboris]
MRKLKLLYLFLLLGPIQFVCAQTQIASLKKLAEAKKLNVIFILTDDHRYDFIGFTNKISWLKTPNLDRMAKEGAYIKNAFVTTSLCSPSRASILTGEYSHVHTIVDNISPEPANLVFFPQYLQKAGYQTSFFGKWHMGEDDDRPRKGFDHWESFLGQGVYWNPQLNIDGKRIQYKDSTYITDLLTDHAVSWLEKRDKKKPFFLYLSHKAVHAPVEPAKRFAGMYKNKPYLLPSTYYQTLTDEYKSLGWPEWVKQQRYSWHGVDYAYHSHKPIEQYVQNYCETLMAVDESVGRVLDYLKQNNLDQNTMVIYMGDNGFSWGEHGLIDKRHFYEESVKVPFLVYCPALFKGGETVTKMIQNVDVAPTILECAGLQKPGYMPGQSFIPLLQNKEVKWRDKIFYEYYWEYDFPMTPTIYGVRTDKYKYIRSWGTWDTHELYDLEKDPEEMHNLIADPKYAELEKQLTGDLFDWLEKTKGMQIPLKRTIKQPSGDYRHPNQY